ncbi:MAG: N-6 DNA methylase [Deinococcales bacterium]
MNVAGSLCEAQKTASNAVHSTPWAFPNNHNNRQDYVSIGTQLPRSPHGLRRSARARVDSGVSRDPSYGSPDGPKSVGAYYTPPPVAHALCDWAIRRDGERALDPAAGNGAFLVEAARRLRELGGAADDLTGIEMRPQAAAEAARRLASLGAGATHVHVGDFLAQPPADWPAFDAVVGNPPYVRFQRMPRPRREHASAVARAAGVRLDSMASSWAAFVLHGTAFLRPGGRMAWVLPSEIGHARYARAVLEHLHRHFASVSFVLFESALFPSLDQGTVLLLADGYGRPFRGFAASRLTSADALAGGLDAAPRHPLDAASLIAGDARLHHAWLPTEAAALLQELARCGGSSRLQDWGTVSIGYVTGHNAFFHLSPGRVHALGLGPAHVRRALFRSRALEGLRVTEDDWRRGAEQGRSGYLLLPQDAEDPAVAAYLEGGERRGVPSRAKVGRRRPWYRVTRTDPPDLVLTAMSTDAPRLAANATRAAVCNTLHGVRLHAGRATGTAELLALASLTSLTTLSAELVGHALGGGLLKLEPSEAMRLALPLPCPAAGLDAGAAVDPADLTEADRALRAGDRAAAQSVADAALLATMEGVGPEGAAVLAAAAERLRSLRRGARRRRDEDEPGREPTEPATV